MHKLMNANKLNPCKLLSVAVIYSLVDGSFSTDLQRGLTTHATSGEPSTAFSLFCKRSHGIRFHLFFSLPDIGIISFLGFAREKKKRKKNGNVYLLGQISRKQHVYHVKGLQCGGSPRPTSLTEQKTGGESVYVIEHQWYNNPRLRAVWYP